MNRTRSRFQPTIRFDALTVLFLFSFGLSGCTPRQPVGKTNDSELVWRTEDITAAIKLFTPHPETSAAFNSGQVLELEQRLHPGESGWTNMKIDIPEHWEVSSVSAENGEVVLKLQDGRTFILNRHNQGDLSFAILDGAVTKPDSALEKIWIRYALEAQD